MGRVTRIRRNNPTALPLSAEGPNINSSRLPIQNDATRPGPRGFLIQLEMHVHPGPKGPKTIHFNDGVVDVNGGTGGERDETVPARLTEPRDRSGDRCGLWEGGSPMHQTQATPGPGEGQ